MRLTCPNCGAQYEVPDEVIPTEGRDVQCSNCGNTWYQAHQDQQTEAEQEGDTDLTPTQDAPEAVEHLDAEPEPTPEPEPDFEYEDAYDDADAPEEALASRHGRELDPAVSEILRQEAEHEANLRSSGGGLESQPDLGLDDLTEDSEHRAREARDRMARMRGQDQLTAKEVDPAVGADSRRGLLPDIEEINSSLRASGDGVVSNASAANQAELAPPQRSGFARGFMLSLLLVVVLVLIYANAPQIAQAVPAVDPALNAFVGGVDSLRSWLDAQIGGIVPAAE